MKLNHTRLYRRIYHRMLLAQYMLTNPDADEYEAMKGIGLLKVIDPNFETKTHALTKMIMQEINDEEDAVISERRELKDRMQQ